MSLKNLLSILCFVLAVRCCVVSAQVCRASQPILPNGTYSRICFLTLTSLASCVSSGDGFYNISVGEDLQRIYILGMCIPEPTTRSVFVRYSNRSFFDSVDIEPIVTENNNGGITVNDREFNRSWEKFMESMIVEASSSSPGSPARKYYAADVAPLTSSVNMYALTQCIPGISSDGCATCLRANVRSYQQCCSGKQGAGIQRPSCFFRWNLYPFLGAFNNIKLPPRPGKTLTTGTIVAIVVSAAIFVTSLAVGLVVWKKNKKLGTNDDDIISPQSLQFDFKTLEAATDKFSGKNKIGQGGFGEVYKGIFPNGTEIAVKRLSRNSGQGLKEFKNEIVVVAKLQHRNLVRILGFFLEGEEQILVYEFVPNKNPVKQVQLDWTKRYNIIGGIARGILYLHHDSSITMIHRDLKASNILLDDDMNPKIADFGMARIFGTEQTRADTSKIAGTYGYMAPEYAMHGQFSVKSDVYSFGVLVLEIITGKMNSSSFHQTDGFAGNLVTDAWRLWRKGSPLELLDQTIGENYQSDEVTRCIHIALLCVQEDPADRPTLSTIILMLTSSSIIPSETRRFVAE